MMDISSGEKNRFGANNVWQEYCLSVSVAFWLGRSQSGSRSRGLFLFSDI